MEKTITTALLILAGIVSMVFVFNSVFPMVNRSSEAMVSMTDSIDDRMKSSISIVHAANSADRMTVYIWIKNIGSSRIAPVEGSDLFFGQEGDFVRVPCGGTSYPRWSYSLENDTEWGPGATLKITVEYDADPGAGTYYIKLVIPNGISAEDYFSM